MPPKAADASLDKLDSGVPGAAAFQPVLQFEVCEFKEGTTWSDYTQRFVTPCEPPAPDPGPGLVVMLGFGIGDCSPYRELHVRGERVGVVHQESFSATNKSLLRWRSSESRLK